MYRCLGNQTWRKDLYPCLLLFLADDVTLLRSLYTINVSSLSARKYTRVLSSSIKCERMDISFFRWNKHIPSTPLYLTPFLVYYSHSYSIQLAPQMVNQHIRCLYWVETLPANLNVGNKVESGLCFQIRKLKIQK
jgi:hypothetical protein